MEKTLEEMMIDLSRKLSEEKHEGLIMRIKVIPEPFEEELNELPLHP